MPRFFRIPLVLIATLTLLACGCSDDTAIEIQPDDAADEADAGHDVETDPDIGDITEDDADAEPEEFEKPPAPESEYRERYFFTGNEVRVYHVGTRPHALDRTAFGKLAVSR